MAFRKTFEMTDSADQLRDFINSSPTMAWSCSSDGSADFFNERWLDYTRLSAEQARDWGWTVALHPDDLNGLVDYWRSVLASSEPGEIEGRLRRFDGVYRWFLFRATPSFDNDGRVVKWFGTNTDIEDRKRAECLLAGENLVLEMTAKGNSLESILEALCRVVEQTASGCYCSVLLFDPSGSKIQQAVAPSLPSSYNDRFPGTPVDREGGPCTEAARRKTQVIVSDVASDTHWNRYGWRTAALTHGLKACWSTTISASKTEAHANPMGTLHGGVLCDIADAAMGIAYSSNLDDGESFTTLELKINFLKPILRARLLAIRRVMKQGRTVGLVECDITDDKGNLVAHATSTCSTLRGEQAQGR